MINPVTVFMTEEEAQKFLLFQKRYEVFEELEKAKAFDIQYGEVVMSFVKGGLLSITKKEVVYHK